MRRFLAAALIVLLCLSLIIPAHAQSTSQNPFTDVQPGDWFYNAVQYVFDNEIMVGTSPTTFVPHAELSRAMVVTILHRMEGEPSVTFRPIFNDVAPDRWYSAAVTWAYDAGIVEGIGGGRFAPNNPITREQLATMMYRLAEDRGYDLNVPGNFSMTGIATDANLVSSWAYEAMCWASFNGFIFTINGALHPQTSASRAETAVFVYRFSGQEAETPTPVPTPTPPPPAVVPPNATAEEWRMFEHVNELRAAHSAPPIQWCNCLGAVARAHSFDMWERNFHGHTNPDGIGPGGRIRNAGIDFIVASENLASGFDTPEAANEGFMGSQSHRATLLGYGWTHIGIGHWNGGGGAYRGLHWTQKFIHQPDHQCTP